MKQEVKITVLQVVERYDTFGLEGVARTNATLSIEPYRNDDPTLPYDLDATEVLPVVSVPIVDGPDWTAASTSATVEAFGALTLALREKYAPLPSPARPEAEETIEERRERRKKRRELFGRDLSTWTRAELTDVLTERYRETVVPPCRLCGSELSIASIGGGKSTVWACSGLEPDPADPENRARYKEGRTPADEHYGRSYFEDDRRGGDELVMELLKRFASAEEGAAAERAKMRALGRVT